MEIKVVYEVSAVVWTNCITTRHYGDS